MNKTLLSVVITILLSCNLFSQGELQFNQVINRTIEGTAYQYPEVVLDSVVVPVGKVWKVESASFLSKSGTVWLPWNYGCYARLGENLIWWFHQDTPYNVVSFPIWLSEGTYEVIARHFGNNNYLVKITFSAIEFNVIP